MISLLPPPAPWMRLVLRGGLPHEGRRSTHGEIRIPSADCSSRGLSPIGQGSCSAPPRMTIVGISSNAIFVPLAVLRISVVELYLASWCDSLAS